MYNNEIKDAYRHMRMNPRSRHYAEVFAAVCEKHGLKALHVQADLRGIVMGHKNRVVKNERRRF